MFHNIRFQRKLQILLFTTFIGLFIVSLVAYLGLDNQDRTSSKYQTLTQVDKSLDNLALNLIKKEQLASKLTSETYPSFIEDLASQKTRLSNIITEHNERLDDSAISQQLSSVNTLLTNYFESLETRLKQNNVVGLDIHSGLKSQLATLGTKVTESISFLTLLKQEFDKTREAEKNYAFEPSQRNFELFEQHIANFREQMANFGLDENFSPAIGEYIRIASELNKANSLLLSLEENHISVEANLIDAQIIASELVQEEVAIALKSAHNSAKLSTTSLIAASLLIATLSYFVMSIIRRSVNQTLSPIINDLESMKAGDLTIRLKVNQQRNDEFDLLCESINKMSQGLGSVIGDVVSTTSDVNNMVSELNQAVTNIANSNRSVSEQTNS
ncbi:methyl-accepting chemotaxis protein, partial [Marinomonas epiphytica]